MLLLFPLCRSEFLCSSLAPCFVVCLCCDVSQPPPSPTPAPQHHHPPPPNPNHHRTLVHFAKRNANLTPSPDLIASGWVWLLGFAPSSDYYCSSDFVVVCFVCSFCFFFFVVFSVLLFTGTPGKPHPHPHSPLTTPPPTHKGPSCPSPHASNTSRHPHPPHWGPH